MSSTDCLACAVTETLTPCDHNKKLELNEKEQIPADPIVKEKITEASESNDKEPRAEDDDVPDASADEQDDTDSIAADVNVSDEEKAGDLEEASNAA